MTALARESDPTIEHSPRLVPDTAPRSDCEVGSAYDYFLTSAPSSTGTGAAATPREAYQLLLHGRGVIIDLRTDRRIGVAAALPQEHLSTAELPAWLLRRSREDTQRVMVLADYNVEALEAVDWLERHGHSRAGYVTGGIGAWQRQGMPIAS